MSNPFEHRQSSLSGPGRDYVPVSPDDASDLAKVAVSLFVETGGAVTFVTVSGATRTVTVPDFSWVVCGASRVMATGTTASGIHAITI